MTGPTTDPELYLRLLVEDAVAALPAPVDEVTRRMNELVTASSALVAVGAVERTVAVRLTRDARTALLARGNEWMWLYPGDLPDVQDAVEDKVRPELRSVTEVDGITVEQWSDYTRVRTASNQFMLCGPISDDSRALRISRGGGANEIPLTGRRVVRHVDARCGPVDVAAFMASLDDVQRGPAEAALRACGLLDD